MNGIFIEILNLSVSASYLAAVIIILRLLLHRAPKKMRMIMWGLLGLRVVCPITPESIVGLLPSAKTIRTDIASTAITAVDSGIAAVDNAVNATIDESMMRHYLSSAMEKPPTERIIFIASAIWMFGIMLLVIYNTVTYFKLRMRIITAVSECENVYLCDIPTPFVLGVFKPKIYLPSGLDSETRKYVLSHERAHIKRFDHIKKPLGFALLTVYWFNPVIWAAYLLFCRDVEFACDEYVMGISGEAHKRGYSEALLSCSIKHRSIAACPLAFGEIGVRKRVKNILNYKKPTVHVIIVSVIACLLLTSCFMANSAEVLPNDITDITDEISTAPITTTAPSGEVFTFPLADAGSMITAEFGYVTAVESPLEPAKEIYHYGIDIKASTGDDVLASRGGKVETAEYNAEHGYYIVILHSDGMKTMYGHCGKLLVAAGEDVFAGGTIAKVGSSGASTGPHLHFEIRNTDGSAVNPEEYLK